MSSGDEARAVDLEVVARHAERLEVGAQTGLEVVVDGQPAGAVGGDEDGVPRAGPAERGRRALDAPGCARHARRSRRR